MGRMTVSTNAAVDAASPALRLLPGEPEAIFIVGASRSGTSLMRLVLESNPRIAIADENHFMGHLLPGHGMREVIRPLGDLADDATIHRIVELLYSPEFLAGNRLRDVSPFWRWLPKKVPAADLERRLLAEERTERGVYRAVLRAYGDFRGDRPILGEKTPAHVRWADELLAWYPTAKVIQMVRDPRGVYVSEVRRRTEHPKSLPYRWLVRAPLSLRAFIALETVYAWSDAVRRHPGLARRHPDRYRMVRFEDLVASPETEIRSVCEFLGVAFDEAMLRQKVVSRGERIGETGFDAGAAVRWRERIRPWDARLITWLLGGRLDRLGYERRWRA
jgi:hypothetical protein